MRRLYLQIYVAFVVVLLIFLVLVAVTWAFMPTSAWQQRLESAGAVIGELIIPPTQSPDELQATVDRLATLLPANVTVRGAAGELLAFAGDPIPAPSSRGPGVTRTSTRGVPVGAGHIAA